MKTRRTDEAGNPLLRKARTIFATLVRVLAPPNGDATPVSPLPEAVKQLENVDKDLRRQVQEAFDRRPIWTKSALAYELKVDRPVLKIAIGAFGYCVSQGPYRLCYVSGRLPFKRLPIQKGLAIQDVSL